MRKLILMGLLLCFTGCAALGQPTQLHYAASRAAPCPVGVVFVANGSGDFRFLSTNLSQVVAESGAPLQVECCAWSHGLGRYLFDHVDFANQCAKGGRLAIQIAEYRRAYPHRHVYLIGHSAGCAVVLAATEALPSDSVDGIVLLAPSVCVDYDLRPALRTSRYGIDVFYSNRDRLILGLGMELVGTADRRCRTAAGQHGFTPVIAGPADAALYCRLRQHPWDPAVEWTGNAGGHYGSNQAGFLRAYVLPLLSSE